MMIRLMIKEDFAAEDIDETIITFTGFNFIMPSKQPPSATMPLPLYMFRAVNFRIAAYRHFNILIRSL